MGRERARFEIPGMEGRLAEAFARSGLTKSALARKCELENWHVGRILAGVLPESFDRLERVAEALGVTWQWLLVGEERATGARRLVSPTPPEREARERGPLRQGKRAR